MIVTLMLTALPFAVVGLLDVVLVSGVALLVFHTPFRGSVLLLFCAVLFLMTTPQMAAMAVREHAPV